VKIRPLLSILVTCALVLAPVLTLGALLGACAKPAPTALPPLASAAVAAELSAVAATFDDATYSPLSHAWLESALARHLAATWHDRAYTPELKDCDDFTDFLVSNLRHWFGEQAASGSGGALIGRYTIWVAEANAWHRVALVRTERGWFVADPQAITPRPWRIPLLPLAAYARPARSAAF
jgi:hypothetical protein